MLFWEREKGREKGREREGERERRVERKGDVILIVILWLYLLVSYTNDFWKLYDTK